MNRMRVACFFTGGYTEVNAMKSFLKKINDRVDYIQLCPTGVRKSKDSIKNRRIESIDKFQNGMTGDALIEYVLKQVEKDYFKKESYDAIIIEDDKDDRFLRVEPDGLSSIDQSQWEDYKKDLKDKLNQKGVEVPVIFFMAAPEVESWFIADYNNSFGKVFEKNLPSQKNQYFAIQFKKYINEKILTDAYRDSVESYGYFEGKYKKLSEEIQEALNSHYFVSGIRLSYSKKKQGEAMLDQIDPQIVSELCCLFFKESFLKLQNLNR